MPRHPVPTAAWDALGEHFAVPFAVRVLPRAEIVWLNARWWRLQGWPLSDPIARDELERWLLASFAVVADERGVATPLYADRYGASLGAWHGGSGRCGYRGAYNAKGIGRTPLVPAFATGDHGDGRLPMHEAIREAIGAELADAELPHGGVPAVAIIAPNDEGAGEAILVRPNVLRPAHFERSIFFGSAGVPGSDQVIDALRTKDAVHAAERDGDGLGFAGLEAMLARFAEQIGAMHAHRLWQGRFFSSNVAVDGSLMDFGSFRAVPSWRRFFGLPDEYFGGESDYLAQSAASLHASFAKYGARSRDQKPALVQPELARAACHAGFASAITAALPLAGLPALAITATLSAYYLEQQRTALQIRYRSNWQMPWINDALMGASPSPREEQLLAALTEMIATRDRPTFLAALARWTCPRPDFYYEVTEITLRRLVRSMARDKRCQRAMLTKAIDSTLSRIRRHFPGVPPGFTIEGQTCGVDGTILYGFRSGGRPGALVSGGNFPRAGISFPARPMHPPPDLLPFWMAALTSCQLPPSAIQLCPRGHLSEPESAMDEIITAYPTLANIAARWEALAHAVATNIDVPLPAPARRGHLVVLGSGMAHGDFTQDAEPEIRSADHVFYCLYDRVTQVWLGRLRPDALDLTVLYSASSDRYRTYMQMAEVLLHHVRRGDKVVAIYYGHPGVFAMPAHRAIQIARREGHQAHMRPGISALDYLVADVGFDPALPGLMSYEATDMLLRKRPIDPSLHVVLWQVGVVGEFGFDPGGFENRGYDLLVDELERTYGSEWDVIHYIAPHYAGVEPLIEQHPIGTLKRPEVRTRISPLSTFYIEPKLAVATDPEMSVALGHSQPGQPVNPPERTYDNARYGEHEIAAVQALAGFKLSERYYLPESTPGIDFMLELSRDVGLRERYREDPTGVVENPCFAALNERARRLLAIPHPSAIAAGIAEPAAPDPQRSAA